MNQIESIEKGDMTCVIFSYAWQCDMPHTSDVK